MKSTVMNSDSYIRQSGLVCPCCGFSDGVSAEYFESQGLTGDQRVDCSRCESTWFDEYRLTGYRDLQQGNHLKLEICVPYVVEHFKQTKALPETYEQNGVKFSREILVGALPCVVSKVLRWLSSDDDSDIDFMVLSAEKGERRMCFCHRDEAVYFNECIQDEWINSVCFDALLPMLRDDHRFCDVLNYFDEVI
ncbi:hypothetical protein [Aliidiomarina quisquiliarum]|uniref:hypothetical protein n=1 Tax=Aliidiomarina quisquiliarum TaxID=2938947 RepID=UPI00208FEE07|nr:hypothetical protein [Aliidiomarina quisquiliarum]MCO4319962.1 hypothetical protein [Aliidiomarina quisquiliarum]